MKKQDISTSILAGAIGFVVAYFVLNFILPTIENVSFSVLETDSSYSLEEPNNEVFNYRAINPTVEVYVGNNGTTE